MRIPPVSASLREPGAIGHALLLGRGVLAQSRRVPHRRRKDTVKREKLCSYTTSASAMTFWLTP
jgi:hypothetical protein